MLRDYGATLKLSLLGCPVVGIYSTATTEDILTKGRDRRSYGMVLVVELNGDRATSLSASVSWDGSGRLAGGGGGEERLEGDQRQTVLIREGTWQLLPVPGMSQSH